MLTATNQDRNQSDLSTLPEKKRLTWGRVTGWVKWLVMIVLFVLAYSQSHLYQDNQNTKFLHGMAQAGYGLLREDWLANTVDPLPVFSFLVQITVKYFTPNLFYIYFAILAGVYLYSIIQIAAKLFRIDRTNGIFFLFFALVVAVHAVESYKFVNRTFHQDLLLLQYGVAGQYLLGWDFQNSTFGVFLLLSMLAFLQEKHVFAMLWVALACIFHPAYLFGGGLLVAAYLLLIFFDSFRLKQASWHSFYQAARKPFFLGLLTLALVLPLILYNQIALASSDPATNAQALHIIVHERIPHHSLPEVWFNRYPAMQAMLVVIALFLIRKTRLFWVMLLPFAGGLLFTFVQIFTGSDSLGLLAPWRVSVFLVPLSTCLIIAFFVSLGYALFEKLPFKKLFRILDAAVVILALIPVVYLSIKGIDQQLSRNKKYRLDKSKLVMDYVKATMVSGDVYMIPPRSNLFDEFRLYSGAPTFINWKSHPYKDTEVLEWYARNQFANQVYYSDDEQTACAALEQAASQYGVTHLISIQKSPVPVCPTMTEIYKDKRYTLYQVKP